MTCLTLKAAHLKNIKLERADIVIFEYDHPDSEYIIVEVKKPEKHLSKEKTHDLHSECYDN